MQFLSIPPNTNSDYTVYSVLVSYLPICILYAGCSFQPESGPCRGVFPSYFWNVTTRQCDKFNYGGCDGNPNRFSTLDMCKACGKYVQ